MRQSATQRRRHLLGAPARNNFPRSEATTGRDAASCRRVRGAIPYPSAPNAHGARRPGPAIAASSCVQRTNQPEVVRESSHSLSHHPCALCTHSKKAPGANDQNFRARRLSVSDIDTSEFDKAKGAATTPTAAGARPARQRRMSMRCADRRFWPPPCSWFDLAAVPLPIRSNPPFQGPWQYRHPRTLCLADLCRCRAAHASVVSMAERGTYTALRQPQRDISPPRPPSARDGRLAPCTRSSEAPQPGSLATSRLPHPQRPRPALVCRRDASAPPPGVSGAAPRWAS